MCFGAFLQIFSVHILQIYIWNIQLILVCDFTQLRIYYTFRTFDSVIEKYNVYQVETIGDNYMVASGVPQPNPNHAKDICLMALDILGSVSRISINHMPNENVQVKIGIHSGNIILTYEGTILQMWNYTRLGQNIWLFIDSLLIFIDLYWLFIDSLLIFIDLYWLFIDLYWSLLTLYWSLLTLYWSLLTLYWLFIDLYWSLLIFIDSLLTLYWSLLTLYWSLLTLYWSLLTLYWLFMDIYWSLLIFIDSLLIFIDLYWSLLIFIDSLLIFIDLYWLFIDLYWLFIDLYCATKWIPQIHNIVAKCLHMFW